MLINLTFVRQALVHEGLSNAHVIGSQINLLVSKCTCGCGEEDTFYKFVGFISQLLLIYSK